MEVVIFQAKEYTVAEDVSEADAFETALDMEVTIEEIQPAKKEFETATDELVKSKEDDDNNSPGNDCSSN